MKLPQLISFVKGGRLLSSVFLALWISTSMCEAGTGSESDEPGATAKIMGLAYGPSGMLTQDTQVSISHIEGDMKRISGITARIRTYAAGGKGADIVRIAHHHGLKVTLGLWMGRDRAENEAEIEAGLRIVASNPTAIDRILVGNEMMLRRDMTVQEAQIYIQRVKSAVAGKNITVSTADTTEQWLHFPELAEVCDFIAAHMLPFWDGIAVEFTAEHIRGRYDALQRAFPDKTIVIAETGWPSGGKVNKASVPTPEKQRRFLQEFLVLAHTERYDYFILEAFDQPWKTADEGLVGANWGIMDFERRAKVNVLGFLPATEETVSAPLPVGEAS